MTVYMKAGDTRPDIEAQLLDANGQAIDLSQQSIDHVQFLMEDADSNTTTLDTQATIDTAAEGRVKYEWNDGDTDAPGEYEGEFRIVFGTGNELTVPTQGFIDIQIERRIDGQ